MKPQNTIFAILLGLTGAFAQPQYLEIESKATQFCEECDKQSWWQINEPIPSDDLDHLFEYLGFDQEKVDFKAMAQEDEPNGASHILLQQYYNGVPIHGGQLKVHAQHGVFQQVHGWYFPPDLFRSYELPAISPKQILPDIIQQLPPHHYAWESPDWEQSLKETSEDPNASHYPVPELYYYPNNGPKHSFSLAFRLNIRAIEPDEVLVVWAAAHSSKILAIQDRSHRCQPATIHFESLYYGTHEMEVRERSWPFRDFVLESCEPWLLSTRKYEINGFGERKSWTKLGRISKAQNQWGISEQVASSGHWAAMQAMNYFSDRTGWVGPAGRGAETRLLVGWTDESGQPQPNARYFKDKGVHYIYVGEVKGKSLVTLDILGHEYAHAFIDEFAQLEKDREPGALSEGLADIFGFLLERRMFSNTGQWNWTIGEDAGFALRSLKDPQDFAMPQAANLQDPFWFPNTKEQCPVPSPQPLPLGNDNCGIHQNSSVISHWFYLLTQGGSKNGIEIRPIDIEEAESILIRMVKYYLLPNASFADARKASLIAASDLFSECSQQIVQIENAWAMVDVGPPGVSECISIQGSHEICLNEPDRQYLFEALGPADASYEWEGIPDNWFYRIQGERNQFLTIQNLPEEPLSAVLMLKARWQNKEDSATLELLPSDCSQKAPRQPDPIPAFDEIRLFPNPAIKKATLYLPEGTFPAQVDIFDGRGRIVRQAYVATSISAFDLNGWNRGIYFVKVHSSKATWQSKLLVIE